MGYWDGCFVGCFNLLITIARGDLILNGAVIDN